MGFKGTALPLRHVLSSDLQYEMRVTGDDLMPDGNLAASTETKYDQLEMKNPQLCLECILRAEKNQR